MIIREKQQQTSGSRFSFVSMKIGRWIFLSMTFVLILLLLCIRVQAVYRPDGGATALKIHEGRSQQVQPFAAVNLFPGDRVTKLYDVKVSYHGNVNLRFHADIHPGYEKLAEVLKCVIYIDGRHAYEGLMRDMPSEIHNWLYTSTSTTDSVPYEITVYLDTSVGNPYQNQELYADFRWWVEESDQLSDNPKTDDPMTMYAAVAAGTLAMICLAWLVYRRQKEGAAGEE